MFKRVVSSVLIAVLACLLIVGSASALEIASRAKKAAKAPCPPSMSKVNLQKDDQIYTSVWQGNQLVTAFWFTVSTDATVCRVK